MFAGLDESQNLTKVWLVTCLHRLSAMQRIGASASLLSLSRKMSFCSPPEPIMLNVRPNNCQSLLSWLQSNVLSCKVLFLGEDHQQSQVIRLQTEVIQHLAQQHNKVKVVMEHFDVEQQNSLDKLAQKKINIKELMTEYQNSDEGRKI